MSLALRDGSEKRLRELDGWRAVSVLFVILHHIAGYQHRRLVSQFSFLDLRVSHIGPLGVDIFFVISGFVICRILVLEELRYGSVSLKGFYCRRIFRILPPFYIYLAALSALLCLGLIHESWRAILCSALFLFDIKGTPSSWFVGHTWSLALEEQFYLIFPTMWVLTPKSWKGQVFLGVFFLISAWNLSMVYTKWDTLTSAHTRVGFGCICCGVLMAIYEARVRALANAVPAFIVAAVALTLLLHPVGSANAKTALYESLFVPPAIGLVLLFSLGRGRWLQAFLRSKPMQAIGLTSYGIYLWQQLFTAPKTYFSGVAVIISLLLPLLCLIVPLSYSLIEKPMLSYGKSLSRRTVDVKTDVRVTA
jgi:peptidoglycan/LPS O-acetylase OafA/YrhL